MTHVLDRCGEFIGICLKRGKVGPEESLAIGTIRAANLETWGTLRNSELGATRREPGVLIALLPPPALARAIDASGHLLRRPDQLAAEWRTIEKRLNFVE